jgi:hypothetical protein
MYDILKIKIPITVNFAYMSGSVPAIFLLRITMTSNKCENLNNWKLDLKVSEFRGRSHKTGVVKRGISLSPNKT